MTSYSVLPSGPRFTIIATWPGIGPDYSAKVTTVTDDGLADDLALHLTRLSEAAWDAAPWLDTSPVIEAAITALIAQLRGPESAVESITLSADGYRHHDQWSFIEAAEVLYMDLPQGLNRLTRTQRLTVADELAADAAGREEALQQLPVGEDPSTAESRAWQACEITRVQRNGAGGPLPEGSAGWLVRAWGEELPLADQWAARNRLTRIEQLVAACQAAGGQAAAVDDPVLCAHLVIPGSKPFVDDKVFYVVARARHTRGKPTSPHAPMVISRSGDVERESDVLAVLDPSDDDGFARVLGAWTRQVPWSNRHVPARPA